ncbi:MAG: hypothetical protein WCK09_00225 [Bacteroidota bacterium]
MTINYQKIKEEIEKRNYRLKYFIPKFAKMGEKGFKLACEGDTLKVDTLLKVSKALKIPMAYWFQEEDQEIKNEIEMTYGENSATIIKRLNTQIDGYVKNEIELHRQIDDLREKLGLGKVGS